MDIKEFVECLAKGFTMDDDRLKNSDGRQRPQASQSLPMWEHLQM